VKLRNKVIFANSVGWNPVLIGLHVLRFWTNKWSDDFVFPLEGVRKHPELSNRMWQSKLCPLFAWDMWRPNI